MNDDTTGPREQDGLFKRHPRLAIFAIAGVFYLTLCAMIVIVLVLIASRV